jgi:superfamily II DNA or RNA helicase
MSLELSLTPGGHLLPSRSGNAAEPEGAAEPDEAAQLDGWTKKALEAFRCSQGQGLFVLAATRPEVPLSLSVAFWREYASRYLTELCRTPELTADPLQPVEAPPPGELDGLLLSAPPMQGGEYLRAQVLRGLWSDLDAWARGQVASSGIGLSSWLKRHAPLWHQVGRVCLHLAENKRDPQFPFAFLATYAPRLSEAGRVQYQPLGRALQEYAGERNKKALISLLAPVQAASEHSALVKELVDSGEIFHPLAWSPGQAYRFLHEVPLLEDSGLLVRLPDWWRKRPRPRVAVTIGEARQGRLGAEAMLDFRVELALGEDKLTEAEWRRIMDCEEGLVFLRGGWVEIDRGKLAEVLGHWKHLESRAAEGGVSFIEGMRLLAGAPANLDDGAELSDESREWSFVHAGGWLSEVLSSLRDPGRLEAGIRDSGFRGTLRPYQEIGHKWLWLLSNLGLGACLADDMGLGKTIQVLSLLLALKADGKTEGRASLLVLPASLLANWKSEIARFAPRLSIRFVHPSESSPGELAAMAEDPNGSVSGVDLVLTTYGMLLRQGWLRELEWGLVILDEAQAIKNPSARQTRAVKQLKAQARIALTGTPVENRLSDLWSLFDFLCPGLLGSAERFGRFVKALERREHDRYAPMRNLVRPYILRRLKTDREVIADLPDKTEVKAYCGLSRKQAALYAASVQELAEALQGLEGIKRRGLVLAYLLRFKQICNHPSQLVGDGVYDPEASGKFERLRALCEEIASRQDKVLVFTQFREMTEPVAAFLGKVFGRPGLVLHGGTPVSKRRPLVEAFQREEGPPFFVLSLKAGGTGLNLTAASHVIHFDRWWNPAVENQATDRAFRIGQHRNVLVHKLICRGTVEEKIDELIEGKTRLAGDIVEGGAEALLTEMSDQELLEAVALDIQRASI